MKLPARRRPSHPQPVEFFNRSVLIFLTVCTKGRRPVLATARFHKALRAAWRVADHWSVGKYVILPDHVHLFCSPGTMMQENLKSWVGYWKRLVSRTMEYRAGLWQVDFWDTQLRQGEGYSAKWEYVRNNPVRHALVEKADHWPFQGELNVLDWHD